jgi:hypothetical protein
MNPLVWIYGGVHHDPGTRQRFLEELAKQETAPHFVAVEWEKSVFEKFVKWRPWVEERLRSRWEFLTTQDCRELSLALAWEGDAYKDRFATADPLWLETGFQEADLERRYGGRFPESIPQSLVHRLCDPCCLSMSEMMANVDRPPEPKSKKELVDHVWQKAWSEAFGEDNNFERDEVGRAQFLTEVRAYATVGLRLSLAGHMQIRLAAIIDSLASYYRRAFLSTQYAWDRSR